MTERLSGSFNLISLEDIADPTRYMDAHGPEIPAVLATGGRAIRSDFLDALPNLKIISSYGVGYDSIDATAAAARGIIVTHTPGVLNDEVANTAIMLWLAVSRRLITNDAYVRSGRWATEGKAPLTHTVQGRTVGIVGLGRIGQTLAGRLQAFDATVVYHARHVKSVGYRYYSDLTEMAAACDVLICVVPGGPDTRHLIDRSVLQALGARGILINISRGSVVDETAMVHALQAGELGGAGLDVFENEPHVPADLINMDNVVLLPHIGSGTHETRQAMADLTCDNLLRWQQDGSTLTPVPECGHL
ncbi:2-hydroxyacid dehydrogenase [Rhodobacteraceae bacterium F11138]|nr:2-hydroxyacid dehydrogenase [Rhodobacteraceae bacterium F11138]